MLENYFTLIFMDADRRFCWNGDDLVEIVENGGVTSSLLRRV